MSTTGSFFKQNYDYKRNKIKILGISFIYKTRKWLKQANTINIEYNKNNLRQPKRNGNKNLLFIASNFIEAGGIETRLEQYLNCLSAIGYNCYILSENNDNEHLKKYTNFILNFDAINFEQCLEEIIDYFNISIIEFQFKSSKFLRNLNIKRLKTKVRVGCVIHNLGVKKYNSINQFDYKIFASKFMYQNHYLSIKNADVIQNGVDIKRNKLLKTWIYRNQKKAILISRISSDKLKSIEGFIRYCQVNSIDFLIGGEENQSDKIKQHLIKNFKLHENVFISQINTLEYLSQNANNILFVGGVGLVVLEALYLNYPVLCCSDFTSDNYSFITKDNIALFDNFTINKKSLVTRKNKKEFSLDLNNISKYQLRDYIIENRNLKKYIEKYLSIIGGRDE